ncbi:MAG: hypothetical protein HYX92_07595 [Chloroflexi bacterium]|nr:hypothetical protein [Chloroflexota bacterium]
MSALKQLGETRFVEVLEPVSESKTVRREITSRLDSLDGKIVGFLDNTKPNADTLLSAVADLLTRKHHLANAIQVRKALVIKTAGPEIFQMLTERADAVVTASGD